jgi:hypothetical protein
VDRSPFIWINSSKTVFRGNRQPRLSTEQAPAGASPTRQLPGQTPSSSRLWASSLRAVESFRPFVRLPPAKVGKCSPQGAPAGGEATPGGVDLEGEDLGGLFRGEARGADCYRRLRPLSGLLSHPSIGCCRNLLSWLQSRDSGRDSSRLQHSPLSQADIAAAIAR